MSDEVEVGPGPMSENSPFLAQVNTVEYSPEQFAKNLVDFYNALIALKIEKSFAERLTIALCQRP